MHPGLSGARSLPDLGLGCFYPRLVRKLYLTCPTTPEDWKQIEETIRTRWNAPHVLSALDRKHIVVKKPKKSQSDYYHYKGFFSLALLALIDTDDRLLWVDGGSSGSSSDAEIFNRSTLRKKIENDWGFHHLNPWGREGQIYTIFERGANYRIT